MQMILLPFVSLGTGFVIGRKITKRKILDAFDKISTVALMFLMLVIGISIGLDEQVVGNLHKIGFNCFVISTFAIGFSVFFTFLCEKTVLPLKKIDLELKEKVEKESELIKEITLPDSDEKNRGGSMLVWVMPSSIILGVLIGLFLKAYISESLVDKGFVISLIFLYVCVGISQGADRQVMKFLKLLGARMIWISMAIFVGSAVGGFVSGHILGLPFRTSVIAAGGMSYYSLTGAFMTSQYGIEVGAYGFLVNVMREFITVVSMPLLIKISVGSPIAGGAAGNMDTMLMPVTKFVGNRLGMVTLLTGTILTFVVPIVLPIWAILLR